MKRIILDLDETLLTSLIHNSALAKKIRSGKKHDTINIENEYTTVLRPNLQRFLNYVFKNFKVSVWTAASLSYALFIVDNVILKDHPERKLDFILFNYHSEFSISKYKLHKDLRVVWDMNIGYNKENTILIDDFDGLGTGGQKNNVYQIEPFDIKTPRDGMYDTGLRDTKRYLAQFV